MNRNQVRKFVKEREIRYIRVLWNDSANQVRAKVVNANNLDILFSSGVAISQAQQAVPFMYDVPELATGLGPVGEVRIEPDWNSLKVVPYSNNQASVLGNIIEGRESWKHCPRAFLTRMLNQLNEFDISIKVGFESEFFVYNSDSENLYISDGSLFAENLSLDSYPDFTQQLLSCLDEVGIELDLFHAEAGPSQYEFSTKYYDPLRAIDSQIYFRELVRALAYLNDINATFIPKLYQDQAGSGCHVHISLWRNGENITQEKTNNRMISKNASFFVAGVLKHLPSLLAVTTPTTNSFRRITPRCWAGAYNVWGYNNREAAIRIPSDDSVGTVSNLEFKTVDHTANLYVALGVLIAAGVVGISKQMQLSEPVDFDPGSKKDSELKQLGVERLPTSLSESLGLFKKNKMLQKAMGKDFHNSYLVVKNSELNFMKEKSFEEEVELMSKRF